ncbi:MAG: GTPase [Methylotenera sp.]
MSDKYQGATEEEFSKKFNEAYEEKTPNYDAKLNIAIIGKVSAGKSSLLNAIFGRDRNNPFAEVGAKSGVTTGLKYYPFGKQSLIIDSPGLDDVEKQNSQVTNDFLSSIDLGIFVVTGSADASQKKNFDELKLKAKNVIVVLNKIDEWAKLKPSAYENILSQWESTLEVDKVYGACAFGYDPEMLDDEPMNIRGVEEIKDAIYSFLELQGKAILFAREMQKKGKYANKIIVTALIAVAAEAFIPGSAAYITATQVASITSLNYLYTGEVMSKSAALTMLPQFIGRSLGMSAFLWAKSFLPPTGIVDVAAAGVAIVITFAMLAAVKWMFENDYSLDQPDRLGSAFDQFKSTSKDALKGLSMSDFINPRKIAEIFERILNK